MLADQIKAMQHVCFNDEPSEADLAVLGSKERWRIYRDLVRHRLHHVVGVALSRTKKSLGEDVFRSDVDRWLAAGGPATRYFRHVPRDFYSHAIGDWRSRDPAWLANLAEYEIASWDVRYAESYDGAVEDFAFERLPIMNPALTILRLEYPVHELPTPSDGYAMQPTILCVYRNQEHKPVPWKLNPLAGDLVEAWARGDKTVTESVQQIATAHNTDISPAFVEKLSTMISDFLTRGLLLGTGSTP